MGGSPPATWQGGEVVLELLLERVAGGGGGCRGGARGDGDQLARGRPPRRQVSLDCVHGFLDLPSAVQG
jgi:hypothetical protein